MQSTDIRRIFLDYFGVRDHQRVPSSSLIPDDESILLTNAGMVPFLPYFAGFRKPVRQRVMSLQKCVRTVDIDDIGRTTRHCTFFEMLGNFSFGEVTRIESMQWAWDLLTNHYGLDPDRLWVTTYSGDDESPGLWRRLGVADDRIQPLGRADNFWSTGNPGPCGPSTEIFYDRGPSLGREGGPAVNPERYLELWNLVFMEFLRGPGAGKENFDIVGTLPARGIDTGLGVERMALVQQDKRHMCEIDLMRPALIRLQELTGLDYDGCPESQRVSMRIITDHVRASAMLISEGIRPGNDGRGYVVRRLLRRALRHCRLLGVSGPALTELIGPVVDTLGSPWSDLVGQRTFVESVISREEATFDRTLRRGSRLLDSVIDSQPIGGVVPGETAFTLHDTYGFPIDLTVEISGDAGLTVDRDGFEALMRRQREMSRSGQRQPAADS
jgi:alanyl-tRNA synthetase